MSGFFKSTLGKQIATDLLKIRGQKEILQKATVPRMAGRRTLDFMDFFLSPKAERKIQVAEKVLLTNVPITRFPA